MDVGFILIVSILVLGGAIATAGDRIGTRVGKARLSLFKLRPRQTAVLVTILTGLAISGSTLGILFATSKPLRTGVFQLDEIQRKLRKARGELDRTVAQKKQTESELAKTQTQKQQLEGELAKTQTQKQQLESELTKTQAQKNQTESELAKSRAENAAERKRLDATNESLKTAIAAQFQTSRQAAVLRAEIKARRIERKELIGQRARVKNEITRLKDENEQLNAENERRKSESGQLNADNERLKDKNDRRKAENERLKAQNNQLKDRVTQGETRLQEREQQLKQAIAQQETRLDELEQQLQEREKQLTFLKQELTTLERYYDYYQVLRQGNVAILRGQVLAYGVLRIVEPSSAGQAVDRLLSEAHQTAVMTTRPAKSNADEAVVQITQAQVDRLIDRIKDGRVYMVRILSAGNYVVGEKQVQVFADAVVNQVVFSAGDTIAATSAEPAKMSEEEIRQRLEQLIVESQFRARRAGVLGDKIQIADDRITTLIDFIEQLKQYKQSVDLLCVAAEDTYTAGPLKMKLIAIKNGKILFST